MNGLPYYKAYPRDFFEGTIGMDFEAKAAYRLLLDLIYMHGGRLVDDPRFIAGQLGCSVKKWNALRQGIVDAGKVSVSCGYLGNYRADKELDSLKSFQTKQRENGSKPKKNKHLAEAMAEPKANHTEPEPDTYKKNAPARFSEFWEAYPHKGAKKGKAPALASYERAVKRGVPEQEIIDGAKRAHLDPAVIAGYVRNPSTWINQKGWEDEIASQQKPQQSTPRRDFWRKVAGA